jgi:pilus assembly protein CpaC
MYQHPINPRSIFMLWIFASAVCLAAVSQAQDGPTNVVIGSGSSTLLSASGKANVLVSNGKVIKVQDLGQKLRITGKKSGSSEIRIGGRVWSVHVLSAEQFSLYQRLLNLTGEMQGLELGIDKDQILLRGRLLRTTDWFRISRAAEQGGTYLFTATMDSDVEASLHQKFHDLLAHASLPDLQLQLTPASLALPSDQDDLKSKYEKVLKPFGFAVDKNSSVLSLAPMVRVHIIVAEVRKNLDRKFGIKWPDHINAQLLPNFAGPGAQGDGVSLQLNALEDSGLAKVLASPNLLCRSGKEAEFLAGGEFPIKILNFKIQDVTWKKYGVLLKVKPQADFAGRMSIALATEVSMIDPSHTVDGIPGLLMNRIESHFDLHKSKTIALSGLLKKEWSDSASGLPGLSQLPILGALFSSQEYIRNQTELIVFVTPEVVQDRDGDS